MTDAHGDDRILGSLRSFEGRGVVRMEERYPSDVDDLWAALTDPDRLARWYGELEGELRLAGDFHARVRASGWQGDGHVEACEPSQRLLLTMRDADPAPGQPDETVIEIVLAADGAETILVLEERGMPLELLAAYGAGIQVHVEDLAAHISGRDPVDAHTRWGELFPSYQALANTISE